MANQRRVRVSVRGADGVSKALSTMSENFDKATVEEARTRAAALGGKLRQRVSSAYFRAGTGRFGRGLGTRVEVSRGPRGGTQATIKVTMINYREAKFLTVFGGVGGPPLKAYYIFAKGQHGSLDLFDVDQIFKGPRSKSAPTKKYFATIGRRLATSRLKVPWNGYEMIKHPRGREGYSPRPGGVGGGKHGSQQIASQDYYYPLWVKHPGFGQVGDVVLEVVTEQGEIWAHENVTNARATFDPSNPQSGITFMSTTVQKVGGSSAATGELRIYKPGTIREPVTVADVVGRIRKFTGGG